MANNKKEQAVPVVQDSTKRFSVLLDPELFDIVEDYRFERRCQTRKEAIIQVLVEGLVATGYIREEDKEKYIES